MTVPSAPLQQGKGRGPNAGNLLRVPASKLEDQVAEVLCRLGRGPQGHDGTDRFAALQQIILGADRMRLTLMGHDLHDVEARLHDGEVALPDDRDPALLQLVLPFVLRRRGGHSEIRAGSAPHRTAEPVLVRALRAARAMVPRDPSGLPRIEVSPANPWRRALIRLAFLAPDVQRAILTGEQAPHLDLAQLLDRPIPLDWQEQRRLYLR